MSPGRRPATAGAARTASRPERRPASRARAGSRPAPVNRSAGARPTAGAARPVRARRVAVLGGVFCVLAVLLAPALRAYLAQQQQVAALRADVTAQRLQVQELSKERVAWNDDAFVRAQARERLKLVLPGERALTVIDDPAGAARSGGASIDPRHPAGQPSPPDRAWFANVWTSVGEAGRSPAGP